MFRSEKIDKCKSIHRSLSIPSLFFQSLLKILYFKFEKILLNDAVYFQLFVLFTVPRLWINLLCCLIADFSN